MRHSSPLFGSSDFERRCWMSQAPGGSAVDFVVQGPESHGMQGLVNLFGIESPGLTSSMALAEYAIDLVR
jgi:L-2-hydroxyglutarate oxidase LhgO